MKGYAQHKTKSIMDITVLYIVIFSFPIEISTSEMETTENILNQSCSTDSYFVNGSCIECPSGFYGISCKHRCPREFYGKGCLHRCTKCKWSDCDSVVGCSKEVPTEEISKNTLNQGDLIVTVSKNITTQEGESVYILCEVESETKVTNITWSFDSTQSMRRISDAFSLRELILLNDSKYLGGTTGNPSLFIKDVSISDKGLYTCTAITDFGNGNASVYLTVILSYSKSTLKDNEDGLYLKIALIGSAALILILFLSLGKLIRNRKLRRIAVDETRGIQYSNVSNYYASINDEFTTFSSQTFTESGQRGLQNRRLGTHNKNNETVTAKTEETEVKKLVDQIYEKLVKSEIGKIYGYSDLQAIIEREIESIKE